MKRQLLCSTVFLGSLAILAGQASAQSTGTCCGKVGVGTTTISDGSGSGGQALFLDVAGAAGATYYCDENGLNCFTASSVSGSAAAITQGDSNVTITDAGDGYITMTEDGAEYLRLTGGKVGIGTTSPDRKLDVLDASNPQIRLTQTDGSVYTDLQTDNSGNLSILTSGTTIRVGTSSSTYAGTFGVKSSTPSWAVESSSWSGNTYTGVSFTPSITGNTILSMQRWSSSGAVLNGFSGGSTEPAIAMVGYTAASSTAPAVLITGWKPNGSNRTAITGTDKVFQFQSGLDASFNTGIMTGLGNGNVGIGTTAPAAKLDIADTTLAGSGSLAGSALNIAQTWNTTGTPTAIKLNVTDTASNASSLLMDLQAGGVSKFKVSKGGLVTLASSIDIGVSAVVGSAGAYYWSARSRFQSPSNGVITLLNNASTDFSHLQFGGTTSSFPALKRNSAGLDVRLADDSGYGNLAVGNITVNGQLGLGTTSPTELLDVNSNTMRLRTAKTPSSASDTCDQGEIAWDADYVYVCVATNTWKRSVLATW